MKLVNPSINQKMDFPSKFCRGVIRVDDQYFSRVDLTDSNDDVRQPLSAVFNDFSAPDPPRPDGFYELSINWVDNNDAITHLFNQKKDEHYTYSGGVCLVELANYKTLVNRFPGKLDYDRDALPDNEYHGNLLMKKDNLEKQLQIQVYAYLAVSSTHIPNPNIP